MLRSGGGAAAARLRGLPMPTSHHLLRVVIIAALTVPSGWSAAHAAADEEPAARVGGDSVSRAALVDALQKANVAALPEGPQRLQAEATVLERLVNDLLMRQAIARAGITADPAAVDAEVQRMTTELANRGATFEQFLARVGRDEAGLRELIAFELALRQFVAARVTPEAVQKYFETNRRELDGSLVRVSHIVLRPDIGRGEQGLTDCMARAKEIRSRILQGELTFAEAARAYSAGPSRRRDGDVGFVARRSVAHEEFARQAFALAKADISQPFATPSGIHLLRVTETLPGTLSLARIRPEIEKRLGDDAVRNTIAEGRRTTVIEVAPGVAHFDPQTSPDGGVPRRVIVAADGE